MNHQEVIWKYAQEKAKKPESGLWRATKAIGGGLLASGVGTLAGFGAASVADMVSKKITGHEIPLQNLMAIAPVVGAASGIAYSLYKSREAEEIRRAIEAERNRP